MCVDTHVHTNTNKHIHGHAVHACANIASFFLLNNIYASQKHLRA